MEEEIPDNRETEPPLRFDPLDPSITDVFVNDAFIAVGYSEVSIVFGTQIPGTDKTHASFRAFMSHETFIGLMALWDKRREFLIDAYGDLPKSLREIEAIEPERVKALYDKMVS